MLAINPKIIATILAKNEADIIGAMIEHHIQEGVSGFIFTDNGSTDATRTIAESYKEVLEIIDEPGDDHNQSVWVTRMARLACKFEPDWIVHLDADEFWCGLKHLRTMTGPIVSSQMVYLHPPREGSLHDMRFYLDFSKIPIPQESKIAHRPNSEITIVHGNHGADSQTAEATTKVYRHHYPIRSLDQWSRKAKGHLALMNRQCPCPRWQKWYEWLSHGSLQTCYEILIEAWENYRLAPTPEALQTLLSYWSTPEVIDFFKQNSYLPSIGEWNVD
jgi:glycosyltransferase involved in cell wall biosynthesis